MSGLCGWIGLDTANAENVLERMLEPLQRTCPVIVRRNGTNCALAAAAIDQKSFDLHFNGHGVSVAILGRPRLLNHPEGVDRDKDIAQALARAFVLERESCFLRLTGAFAVAVFDHERDSVSLAVDRMGIHPITFVPLGGGCVFGSSNSSIDRHPMARGELDPQALYQYFYFHVIPAPATIYRGFQRLVPGQYAIIDPSGVRVEKYWSPTFQEQLRPPLADLELELIDTLRDAVREAAGDAKTGCFLSGGMDSSTLAGLLCEVNGAPAPTYSIGFDEPGYDEMRYARIAAKHFGTLHHEYYVNAGDIADTIAPIAVAFDQPYGNSSVLPAFYCARMAKEDGVDQLLGGDGGDELFGGNTRYAKQYVFSLYEKLPAAVRAALGGPLLPSWSTRVPVLRKAKSYVDQASIALPERLETYNLLERIGPQTVFNPEFLAQVDVEQPRAFLRSIYADVKAQSDINRMLGLDFRITLADNDLPKVNTACALARISAAFPFLDDRVVAFSTRLAPELKLKRTKLRYFFKRALRDYLPAEVIAKQKHGFGLPFGSWVRRNERLRGIVNDSLSGLKQRKIIRPELIDSLTSTRLDEHAEYYGTLVWVLVMLEQWWQGR